MQLALESKAEQVGFVMVKPHAFDMCLDPVISEILQGNGLANQLATDDQLRPVLDKLKLGNPTIRNLATVSYGSKLLELLYGDKITRRYYPLIQEYYLGKIAIIPYLYDGVPTDMPQVYNAIKGKTETHDQDGRLIDKRVGLRGLLGEPYLLYDTQSSIVVDNETYRRRFTPVVNNYIHVSDSTVEITEALQLLFAPTEWAKTLRHIS